MTNAEDVEDMRKYLIAMNLIETEMMNQTKRENLVWASRLALLGSFMVAAIRVHAGPITRAEFASHIQKCKPFVGWPKSIGWTLTSVL
jgi:hypothetical protein